jgi:pilus assembly protein CpaE
MRSGATGRVSAVFSVKGGVGKTTIAVNLAVGLGQLCQRPPLLVDGNLYFGDVPILMNYTPRNSISDLCTQPEFDALTLRALVSDEQFGVSILGSPPDMTAVDQLDTQVLTDAIPAYRSMFDHIVVDTRSSLDEVTLQILDAADRILLLITPELSALYQTSRFLAVAGDLGYDDKIALILNRAGSGLDVRSVEEHLGRTVFAHIVSAGPQVLDAANRGVPLLIDDTDCKKQVTRDLRNLVEKIAGVGEARVNASVPQAREARHSGFLRLPGKLLLGSAS